MGSKDTGLDADSAEELVDFVSSSLDILMESGEKSVPMFLVLPDNDKARAVLRRWMKDKDSPFMRYVNGASDELFGAPMDAVLQ